jgi:hypothetical protein
MDQKRGGGQMSEDEEGLKGMSLITQPGGEHMTRGKMAQKITRQERGPCWLNTERQRMFGFPMRC